MIHTLKCWLDEFVAIKSGRKRFEIRREDDRHFDVGDTIVLRAWAPVIEKYDPSQVPLRIKVIHLTRGPNWGIPEGMVVMSIARISTSAEASDFRDVASMSQMSRVRVTGRCPPLGRS